MKTDYIITPVARTPAPWNGIYDEPVKVSVRRG